VRQLQRGGRLFFDLAAHEVTPLTSTEVSAKNWLLLEQSALAAEFYPIVCRPGKRSTWKTDTKNVTRGADADKIEIGDLRQFNAEVGIQ
jgi:hypothetical protein